MFVPETQSRPPPNLAIPYEGQLLATTLTHVPLLYFIYIIISQLKNGDSTALWFGLGGTLASAMEPIVDVMGFCFFAREGSWVAFEFFGRPMPYFIVPCYSWFVGGQGYWFYTILRSKTTTRSDVWKLWCKSFAANLALEYPAMYFGMYTYYGFQPLAIGGFPLWFPAIHSVSPMMSAVIVYLCKPYLIGYRKCYTVAIACCTYGMANAGLGWPVWCALSLDNGYTSTYIASALTLSFIYITIWSLSLAFPETGTETKAI